MIFNEKWDLILKALKDINYSGPWLYELEFASPATMPRSRDLTCEDFARNAKELFDGSTLTVIH